MNDGPTTDRLGKYELRGTLGKGAMGTVFDGWDPVIARRVAIKTVRLAQADDADGQETLARFRREAQAAGRLNHPNIVGVYDYGETDEVAFIVMEHVDGRTLKHVLDADERLALPDLVRLVGDVLDGLTYSHALGVIHRDIKPANIMLTGNGRAKIADFGIARIESSNLTQAGTVLGTPAYMSPEQFMGQVVDQRTDIYSTGVLLYHLLTGERPFEGSLTGIMHKVLNTSAPDPSAISVTAPRSLDAVVRKAMARRPDERYDTAASFADALRNPAAAALDPAAARAPADDETIVAAPPASASRAAAPPPDDRAARPASGRGARLAIPLGAAGLLAVAGLGLYLAIGRSPERPPERPAVTSGSEPQSSVPAGSERSAPPAAAPAPAPAPALSPSSAPTNVPAPSSPAAPTGSEPAPPPAPVAAPAIRSALDGALSTLPCSLVRATVASDGGVTLAGLAGAAGQGDALADAVRRSGGHVVGDAVEEAPSTYCGVLDALRPVANRAAGAAGAVGLAQVGGPHVLDDDAVIALDATLPAGGYLTVAYVANDGSVALLVPGFGNPATRHAPGTELALGTPSGRFTGWRVGAPFGTDMVVAIASAAPLVTGALPTDATRASGFAAWLGTTLAAAAREGSSVGAAAVLVRTAKR